MRVEGAPEVADREAAFTTPLIRLDVGEGREPNRTRTTHQQADRPP